MRIGIVEDEYLEREALQMLLKSARQPVNLVFMAKSGMEAIELIQKHRPQLVLLDIQTPQKSGLDVLGYIHDNCPQTLAIILTAYSRFDYAQQAINLGAEGYLLKPYSAEKLYDALDAAQEKLERLNAVSSSQHALAYYERGTIQMEILAYAITGVFTQAKTRELIEQFLSLQPSLFRCMLFHLENVVANSGERAAVVEAVEKLYPCVAASFKDDLICLACRENDTAWPLPERVTEIIKTEVKERPVVTHATSLTLYALEQLPHAYRDLHSQLHQDTSEFHVRARNALNLYALEKRLNEKLASGDWEQVESTLESIRRAVCVMNNYNIIPIKGYFSHLWRQLDRTFYHEKALHRSMDIKYSIDERLYACQNSEDITDALLTFFMEYIGKMNIAGTTEQNRVINVAKDYIEQQLAKNITLESVAEVVGFSPPYLSRLFKKVEGVNFKEYLIRMRMERAKRLLVNSNMNVTQVAAAVGYPNANYFSSAFRQYFGISPWQQKTNPGNQQT